MDFVALNTWIIVDVELRKDGGLTSFTTVPIFGYRKKD